VIDFDFLKEEGVIASEDLEIFKIVENGSEAWKHILDWHECKGAHLFI